jgi:hypothetical protein
MEERLAEPGLSARRGLQERGSVLGLSVRGDGGFLHLGSSLDVRRPLLRNRSRKAARAGIQRAPASLHPGH